MTGTYTHLGENERKRSGLSESGLTTGGVAATLLISIGRASPGKSKETEIGRLRGGIFRLVGISLLTSSL
jgi:hypothetical protein